MGLVSVNTPATVIVRGPANHGVLAGLLGCVFGVLGIFTLGIIFVPLAALCSLVGLIRAAGGLSLSGIGCSLPSDEVTRSGLRPRAPQERPAEPETIDAALYPDELSLTCSAQGVLAEAWTYFRIGQRLNAQTERGTSGYRRSPPSTRG